MKEEKKMVRLNVDIEQKIHDRMKFDFQKKTGKSLSEQVREAIEQYLGAK